MTSCQKFQIVLADFSYHADKVFTIILTNLTQELKLTCFVSLICTHYYSFSPILEEKINYFHVCIEF